MPLFKSYGKIQYAEVEISNIAGTGYVNVIPEKQLFITIRILWESRSQVFKISEGENGLTNISISIFNCLQVAFSYATHYHLTNVTRESSLLA